MSSDDLGWATYLPLFHPQRILLRLTHLDLCHLRRRSYRWSEGREGHPGLAPSGDPAGLDGVRSVQLAVRPSADNQEEKHRDRDGDANLDQRVGRRGVEGQDQLWNR